MLSKLLVLLAVVGYVFATSASSASGAVYSCRPPYNPHQVPGHGHMSNALAFSSRMKKKIKVISTVVQKPVAISKPNIVVGGYQATNTAPVGPHNNVAITGPTIKKTFYCKVCKTSGFAGNNIRARAAARALELECDVWAFEFEQPVSVLNGLDTFCPEGLGNCMCHTVATRLLQDPDGPTRRLGEQLQTALANGLPPPSICGGNDGGVTLEYGSLEAQTAKLEEETEALELELYE